MNLQKLTLGALLAVFSLASCFGQAVIGSTTLSGAVSATATVWCVASATGIVTPSLATAANGSLLLVDSEAAQITGAGPTSTCFRVHRSVAAASNGNGGAAAHASSAKVWILGATVSTGDPSRPTSSTAFLSQRAYAPFELVSTPPLLGVAAADVAGVAGKTWYAAAEVHSSMLATGACVLNGATVTNTKTIVALYDATGTLVASSALAGATTAGVSVYQCQAFTGGPIAIIGPAQYFLATQTSGTDSVQMYAATSMPTSYPTGSKTGTFGVLPTLPVTTSFTATVGPLMTLY